MRIAAHRDASQTRLRGEIIAQLVRKDLKVKYQGSTLGFIWSLANPLLLLVVYTFVFAFVLKNTVPWFGFFLMSGLLVWTFFSSAVSSAAGSIIANAGLVKKVPFAHSSLPLASVGVAGVQAVMQYIALLAALVVFGLAPIRPHLLLLVPAIVVALTLTVGLSLFVAASTVRLRDTQHLLEVGLFAWMWLTPTIYPASLVTHLAKGSVFEWAYYLNPMAGVVVAFQRALYGVVFYPQTHDLILPSDDVRFYFKVLALGGAVALGVLALGVWQFRRMSADFAEDL